MNMINNKQREKFPAEIKSNESGFSLIEMIIALVILLVAVLGIYATFTFAVVYNGGNSRRSQALSVLQSESELLRSAKFTPTIMDASLTGGTKTPKIVTAIDGFSYLVEIKVDDDPFTPGIQVDNLKTLKEITVLVTPQNANGRWVTALPTNVVFRRVRAN